MRLGQILPIAIVVLIPTIGLAFTDQYLMFHVLAECFVAGVAAVVFSIAWHTRRVATNDYLTFVGMAALPFALVILLHMLAYRGMPTFPLHDTDLPTQLWLIARVLQASSLVIAPWYATHRLKHPAWVLAGYAAVGALLVAAAASGNFPAAFIEGQGLTPFKIWTEYAVIAATIVGALGLFSVGRELNGYVRSMLLVAMGCIIVAELAFTLYTDPFGAWNRMGHILHVGAAVAIYGALVHSSLEAPLQTLFLRLKERELDLAAAYQQEHDIAETLQSAMAVQPSNIEGLDLGYRYLPAAGVGRIGGDFYDLFHLENTLVGFLIGDVCGKGLRAASTTFRVRSVVRALALSDPEPARVLESVNHYLYDVLEDGMFVTAVFGTIDTVTGETRYAVAGHPDPAVCGRRELVVADADRAMPLGVAEQLGAVTQRITLLPGDGMVLVTDGVIDTPGPEGRFGTERLDEIVHSAGCATGAEPLIDRIVAEVHRFAGTEESSDDIAIVAIRFTPAADAVERAAS